MADLNPFSKVLQKHAGRAKERLLQNLGKADKTTDEDFDLHVKNFAKQQTAALRLHKEFKNYYLCLRAMQNARRSLMDTVCELYEPCWDGVEQFLIKTEVSNKSFDDFCNKINEELLAPVGCYTNQFPEIVTKISKRKRKLLDYDNCRHNLQNLETMKKREDGKIAKAKEQLDHARSQFEVINSELHDELPALYDSRVSFFASNLQFIFLAEANFHKQDGELFVEISGILNSLNEASKKGSFAETPKLFFDSKNGSPESSLPPPEYFLAKEGKLNDAGSETGGGGDAAETLKFSTPPTTTERNVNLEMVSETATEVEHTENEKPEVNSKVEAPPVETNVLYQVKGTYKYTAEDADELSFDVGDVIDVVAYDDPEEQEDGWLMGVFDGKKGLFPANFTSRI